MNVLSLFKNKYMITDKGDIISNVGKSKKLIGKITNAGYRQILLTVEGQKLYINVHRLIAKHFIDNPNNLPEVNHKDGNKLNNNIDNLEWVTSIKNQIHSRDILKNNCKINKEIATKIRKLYKTDKYTYRSLEKLFDIKKTQIGYIIKNMRWKIETY